MTSQSALDRLPGNIGLLKAAVSGLERVLRAADELDDDRVQRARPFVLLLWLYAVAMRDLLSSTATDGRMLWNAPALAALCRPLQEAFVSFYYFGIEAPNDEEREFRELLLARHKAYKRLDLLLRISPRTPEIEKKIPEAEQQYNELHGAVTKHTMLSRVPKSMADGIRKNGDRCVAEPMDQIWLRAGMPAELYDVTFRYLSQFAHATPFAIEELAHHVADQEEGAVNMNIPVSLALTCTCVTLRYMGELDERIHSLLPDAFHQFMGE